MVLIEELVRAGLVYNIGFVNDVRGRVWLNNVQFDSAQIGDWWGIIGNLASQRRETFPDLRLFFCVS